MEWFSNLSEAAQVGLVGTVLTPVAAILSALLTHWTTMRTVIVQSKQSFRERRGQAYSDFIVAAMKYVLSMRDSSSRVKGAPFDDPVAFAEFLSTLVVAQSYASKATQSKIIKLESNILDAVKIHTQDSLSAAVVAIQAFAQDLSKELSKQ